MSPIAGMFIPRHRRCKHEWAPAGEPFLYAGGLAQVLLCLNCGHVKTSINQGPCNDAGLDIARRLWAGWMRSGGEAIEVPDE